MTGHDAADGAELEQGVGGVYRPWTPGSADRSFDAADGDGWVDERDPFTRAASEQDREPGVRLRRAPSGMGRRDRREWKMLEAARVHRLRTDELRSAPEGSFRPGFVTSPPKYLDRRSRRAWLAIERESSKSWWEHRRWSNRDVGNRERGALAVALVAGGLLSWWVIAGWAHHPAAGSTTAPAVSSTASASSLPAAPPVSAAAAAASVPSSAPAAAPVSTAAASRPGPAGEPGQLGTLDHGWSPTPAGGVPPIAAPPSATPINPGSVHLIARPTAAVTAADTADPKAAVTAWAARMCPQRWTDTFLADRAPVKPLMTTSGWADEVGDPQEQDYWAFAADRKQEIRCAAVTVTVSPDQPTGGGLAYVLYRGLRVVTIGAPGGSRSAPVVTVMSGVRTVLRQPDGRWLVDVAAPPGG